MEDKIQLQHLQGKKLNKMALVKYEPIKAALIKSLKKDQLTHDELIASVKSIYSRNKLNS